jgi:hypothetical protein
MNVRQPPADETWHDQEAGPVVRPYAITRGRTEPAKGDFDLISLVVSTDETPEKFMLEPEHRRILALCRAPVSVAEISADLDLPLGTVRVMLGDLVEKGLIQIREPQAGAQSPPEQLLKAVINGLRSQ